eukprot:5940940-Amphidinium_carterae.1
MDYPTLREVGILRKGPGSSDRIVQYFLRFLGNSASLDLGAIFANDANVSATTRVLSEKVVHYYEALLRKAFGQTPLTLD